MLFSLITTLLFAFASPAGWKEYTDSTKTFTVVYPENWEVQDAGQAITFASPREDRHDIFRENVNVIQQRLTGSYTGINLEDYTSLSKKQIIALFGDTAVQTLKDTVVAGQAAKECLYKMKYEGNDLQIKEYWFIRNNIAYLLTYTAQPEKFKQYENDATRLMLSFRFL